MSPDGAMAIDDRLDSAPRPRLPARGLAFLTLLALAAPASAASHLFLVRVPGKRAYHASIVFLVAAALVLPPELLILMGVATNLPEWLRERFPWYVQSSNIFNYTLATMGAW